MQIHGSNAAISFFLSFLYCVGRGEYGDVQLARLRNPTEEVNGDDNSQDADKLVMVKVSYFTHTLCLLKWILYFTCI